MSSYLKAAFKRFSDVEKLIIIDPEAEYDNMIKQEVEYDNMVKLHKDFRANSLGFALGELGHGSMIRTFSEDEFNPKLVPNYVKNISVEYNSETGKKYFTYADDYGRGETNA